MVKFNDKKFEKIVMNDSLSLYGYKKNKIYLFNETSRYIFERIISGILLDDIIEEFCENGDYDLKIVKADFEKTIQFFYIEEIIYNE